MPWFRRRPARPRSDPLTIAVLEYELFGTRPEPDTAAAAAVNLAIAFGLMQLPHPAAQEQPGALAERMSPGYRTPPAQPPPDAVADHRERRAAHTIHGWHIPSKTS
ncbi:hypothetical protein SAMN04490357_0181 [Streptomyces misionensis]|uniref:Uncharacterized protein n=1 Tax=Streptomyces misionensis TaxID=67331 RepID=A0A1H4ICG8_9ACTN|nr:hypothetical protein [Streptomyces misionensis]SEB31595.1 hypothetical protein SAMN04490357_0181 [Streptomyces misionensis]